MRGHLVHLVRFSTCAIHDYFIDESQATLSKSPTLPCTCMVSVLRGGNYCSENKSDISCLKKTAGNEIPKA